MEETKFIKVDCLDGRLDKSFVEVANIIEGILLEVPGSAQSSVFTPDQARTLATHLLTLANKAEE